MTTKIVLPPIPKFRSPPKRKQLWEFTDEELALVIKNENWAVNRKIVDIAKELFIQFHDQPKEYRESAEGLLAHKAIATIATLGWTL